MKNKLKIPSNDPEAIGKLAHLLCNERMENDQLTPDLPWIEAGMALPSVALAWGSESPAPGLLAASQDLSAERLLESYSHGIFPWFSTGQPVLWWSPDPRMVLKTGHFRFHRSLRQSLKRWLRHPGFDITFDRDFSQVMRRCSEVPRSGQNGTWIVPSMRSAYEAFHKVGHAHSAEVWLDGELIAGLYFVAVGQAVFGESMFTTIPDGSKMALAGLVSVCLKYGIPMIDCQQNTRHLASMGAFEITRADFLNTIQQACQQDAIPWAEQTLYWETLANLNSTP